VLNRKWGFICNLSEDNSAISFSSFTADKRALVFKRKDKKTAVKNKKRWRLNSSNTKLPIDGGAPGFEKGIGLSPPQKGGGCSPPEIYLPARKGSVNANDKNKSTDAAYNKYLWLKKSRGRRI